MTALWTITQAAAALGLREQTLRKIRKLQMPRPDVMEGRSPRWYPATIIWWAVKTGRMDPATGAPIRLYGPGRPPKYH